MKNKFKYVILIVALIFVININVISASSIEDTNILNDNINNANNLFEEIQINEKLNSKLAEDSLDDTNISEENNLDSNSTENTNTSDENNIDSNSTENTNTSDENNIDSNSTDTDNETLTNQTEDNLTDENNTNTEKNENTISNEETNIRNTTENDNLSDTNTTDNTETNNTNTTDNTETNNTNITENNSTENITKITTKITYPSMVLKSNYLNIVLKDNDNNLLANQTVQIKVYDSIYYKTTDSNGVAKLKINLKVKTHKFTITYEGDDTYAPLTKSINVRVLTKPIYTKLSFKASQVMKGTYLYVYLKTSAGKVVPYQNVKITVCGKTYTKKTNKNGITGLKINLASKTYKVKLNYTGQINYMDSSKSANIKVIENVLLGKTNYGKVELLKVIGNQSSKIKIAYVVGLHPIEYQIHDAVYNMMKKKTSMKYAYYVYKITLTKKTGNYATDRMRGQLLAKNYIVPHVKKQNYKLVVDIHSTTGVYYKYSYFIHVPQNSHKASLKLAYKTINMIKSIEKGSKMRYYSPESQTSPPYLTLPIMKSGTPTFVFETLTSESVSQTNKRANILINAIDKIFG